MLGSTSLTARHLRVWLGVAVVILCCWACRSPQPGAVSDLNRGCASILGEQSNACELIVKPVSGVDPDAFIDVFRAAGVTGCVARSKLTGACLVRLEGRGDAIETARRLMAAAGGRFEYVVPNAPVYVESGDAEPPIGTPAPTVAPAAPECPPPPALSAPPADAMFGMQIELNDAHLRAATAWSAPAPLIPGVTLPPPSRNVVTALIDTGVQRRHEDLRCNLVEGKDFSCGTESCPTLPEDDHGHGTQMAGIIAASANAVGVRGIAWNTKLVPLKVTVKGKSTDWQVSLAVQEAVSRHVSVVNSSYKSLFPMPATLEAMTTAAAQEVLFVAAAGNDGWDLEKPGHARYPAVYSLPNTITVMSDTSNYGAHSVDVAAPQDAYTTQLCTADFCTVGGVKCERDGCYDSAVGGSSVATAYVSGAAALIKSIHPDWSAPWIKALLLDSAKPDRALKCKSRTGARLNLVNALVGPLHVLKPAAGETWHTGAGTVHWSNMYRTTLCTAVTIELASDGLNYSPLSLGVPNIDQATIVVPSGVSSQHNQARLRISCAPGGFRAVSDPFTLDGHFHP